MVIPRAALLEEEGIYSSFVVEGNTVEKRYLVLGILDNDHVEVLSGLTEGERVATHKSYSLMDGMGDRRMSGLSRFAVENKGAMVFTALLLSLIGLYLIFEIPQGVFPDATFPRIAVMADYGLAPLKEMEMEIAKPIEEAAMMVEGVRLVRASISRGSAEINIDFEWDQDMFRAYQLVQADQRHSESTSQRPTIRGAPFHYQYLSGSRLQSDIGKTRSPSITRSGDLHYSPATGQHPRYF